MNELVVTQAFPAECPRTPGKEQVMVFPKSRLHINGGFESKALVSDAAVVKQYLNTIFQETTFIDREHAEKDEEWLQIIPYTVIVRGREVFRYQRTKKGGENRLHDKWSVGVGGHVNPGDGEGSYQAYLNAFDRELAEEVAVDKVLSNEIVGLIYCIDTSVDRVHFGIVHLLRVPFDATMTFNDPALSNGRFEHIVDLQKSEDNFENWSRLVIKGVL